VCRVWIVCVCVCLCLCIYKGTACGSRPLSLCLPRAAALRVRHSSKLAASCVEREGPATRLLLPSESGGKGRSGNSWRPRSGSSSGGMGGRRGETADEERSYGYSSKSREEERCLLTIYDLPEVGKRNALSANTAAGHSQPSGIEHYCHSYTPTLRLSLWHAWRTHGGRHRMSIQITYLLLRDSAPRETYLRRRFRDPRERLGEQAMSRRRAGREGDTSGHSRPSIWQRVL
jgi:hypothetical protein